MKFNRTAEWLKEWQNEFQTCFELWQELEANAMAHHLSNEQHEEVAKMMMRYRAMSDECYKLTDRKERRRRFKEELDPLYHAFEDYCKNNGYPNFVFIKGGKKGLRTIAGLEVLPPIYEEISFTFDDYIFLNCHYWSTNVVKKDGKWGVVDSEQHVIIPFEYDFIFRKPGIDDNYILLKDGKQGMANIKGRFFTLPIKVEMDAIYDVPEMELSLFSKDGKWGWWWPEDREYPNFYEHYCGPKYDEIFVQRVEYRIMDDEFDEYFYARLGDELFYILYWTIK